MTTNLTTNKIKDTYSQLLHVDGGPEATEKVVYSGTGVATALKVGTVSASAGNVRIAGNTISSINTNGNITLSPNGTGSVVIPKIDFTDPAQARTELGLGTAALAATGDFATAAQGTLAGTAVQPGSLGTAAFQNTSAFATSAQGSLADTAVQPGDLGTMATQDASAVNITGGTMSGVTLAVAFGDVTGRAHGIFYDLSSQTFLADTATVVEFDTTGLAAGVSVVSNTRITFAAAGVYEVSSRLQFENSANTDHPAVVWFRLDGADIPYSASEIVIPKSSYGGAACQTITGILQVTAGQYLEIAVAVGSATVSLQHSAPATTPYIRPDIPSVILVTNRIA